MSVTAKAKSATRFGLKVQRRIVIAQALWWPTLIVGATALGAAAAVIVKRRRSAVPQPDPVAATPVTA
ncbi:hypothetical protein [Mycolicibacterium bacteremicum]|uniref:Uncharacterized protein n=1 Tax=Mycolicibacterium bacteremicum TaxID=564198 RepID=A0A1W9YYZ4_MYCBA|nr:hypothetical protein [Mycolicibacterium bacteremicum]MCV7435052.1 hypothetical protein [Mycolicibacterium bacteremicum]ORA05296.1 hypothetical protein BST17_08720 [Mycolicibacterium bacteremicum]